MRAGFFRIYPSLYNEKSSPSRNLEQYTRRSALGPTPQIGPGKGFYGQKRAYRSPKAAGRPAGFLAGTADGQEQESNRKGSDGVIDDVV